MELSVAVKMSLTISQLADSTYSEENKRYSNAGVLHTG